MYGPDRLFQDLRELGYEVEPVTASNNTQFAVIQNYCVPIGRFQGRIIDLGIQATNDFPRTVAPSIHVRANPQLFEKTDTLANVRNIIDSPLGSEWRYWSHSFLWETEKTTRRLMNHIKGIFAHA
jgi:hypothetical protein